MTEPLIAKKKRGRPKKVQPDGQVVEKKRPDCETAELAKYPEDGKEIIWGSEPASPNFKRKGLAILYNKKHQGGMVTLMPVTEDEGVVRWRYRFIPGPMPFHYDKIDLEPNEVVALPKALRKIADVIEKAIEQWFGGPQQAVQKTVEFQAGKQEDRLGDKFRKMGVF